MIWLLLTLQLMADQGGFKGEELTFKGNVRLFLDGDLVAKGDRAVKRGENEVELQGSPFELHLLEKKGFEARGNRFLCFFREGDLCSIEITPPHELFFRGWKLQGKGPFRLEWQDKEKTSLKGFQKTGGVLVLEEKNIRFSFEGMLVFDKDRLSLEEGRVEGKSEELFFSSNRFFLFSDGENLRKAVLDGGVELGHTLTSSPEVTPLQISRGETLEIDLERGEAFLFPKKDEKISLIDLTHGIEVSADSLFMSWDEEGKLKKVEGKGQTTIKTIKKFK